MSASDSDNHLLHNLLVFARLLRGAGLNVSLEQVSELARITETIGIAQREDFYYAARALFVRRREQLPVFDRAFELFFSQRGRPQHSIIDPTQAPTHRAYKPVTIQQLAEREREQRAQKKDHSADESPEQIDRVMTFSPDEMLWRKSFDQFDDEEIRRARRLVAAMDWRIGERRTRRKRSTVRGHPVDFARLVRRNLKHGGELFHLPAREPKFKPRPLVVLADISGSMERYTRVVLHLLHALTHEVPRLQVFVFGTRLTHVTPHLKRRSIDEALARVSQHVLDFSGGTRIGDALKTFNFKWTRRILRAGAVVMIISDGWDRGDLELLRDEMARLQRSCSRLIWLNPLLGQPSFEVAAQGLQVALPFVDDFLPIHDLTNLETLVAKLSTLGVTRPLRRQNAHVIIPTAAGQPERKFMPLPQMGTSDYVRRTLTVQIIDGVPRFEHRENPVDDTSSSS